LREALLGALQDGGAQFVLIGGAALKARRGAPQGPPLPAGRRAAERTALAGRARRLSPGPAWASADVRRQRSRGLAPTPSLAAADRLAATDNAVPAGHRPRCASRRGDDIAGAPLRAPTKRRIAAGDVTAKENPMTDQRPGVAGMTEHDFAYLERLASSAADSGLYGGGAKIKAQLLMKLIYGRDLAIPVSAALSAIDIYDGKMELSSNLVAALVEAHPHYAYAIVHADEQYCELEFFKDGRSLGNVRYDASDATRAGLAETEYYRQFPSDMFFARAMTRGARRHCPGFGRGVAIYATGELAKRTPEPTAPGNGNGRAPRNGADAVVRATPEQAATIRALATDAGIGDAELFNVIITAGDGTPVADEERAAGNLKRALERMPRTLIEPVCQTLRERPPPRRDRPDLQCAGCAGRQRTLPIRTKRRDGERFVARAGQPHGGRLTREVPHLRGAATRRRARRRSRCARSTPRTPAGRDPSRRRRSGDRDGSVLYRAMDWLLRDRATRTRGSGSPSTRQAPTALAAFGSIATTTSRACRWKDYIRALDGSRPRMFVLRRVARSA